MAGPLRDAFHIVIPSLPGYGFSAKPTAPRLESGQHRPRLGDADAAPRLRKIRCAGRRLGQCRFGSHGSAAAAGIARHPHQHGGNGSARRVQGAFRRRPRRRPASRPRKSMPGTSSTTSTKTDWAMRMRCRCVRRRCTASPIRRSVSRAGSSITTFASYEMIARVFDGKPEGLTRDDILDNITLYWLTNTAISSARPLLGHHA